MATIQLSGAAYAGPNTAPLPAQPAVVVALSPNGNQATAANQATEIAALTSILTQLMGTLGTQLNDMSLALRLLLEYIANPISQDPLTGRVRVSLDNNPTVNIVATSGALNTVGTVNTIAGFGPAAAPIPAANIPPDIATTAYATRFRGRIV